MPRQGRTYEFFEGGGGGGGGCSGSQFFKGPSPREFSYTDNQKKNSKGGGVTP